MTENADFVAAVRAELIRLGIAEERVSDVLQRNIKRLGIGLVLETPAQTARAILRLEEAT